MTVNNALNQMKARSLGRGKFADGQGLWLIKSKRESGKWILRIVVDGKRREMGLGRWPDVSIAEARQSASEARRKLRGGIEPIQERRKHRRRASRLTVAEAVQGCFAAKQAELKNDGKAGRWMSPLDVHVLRWLFSQMMSLQCVLQLKRRVTSWQKTFIHWNSEFSTNQTTLLVSSTRGQSSL
jgi:Arm DNA-binding domain